MSEQHSEPSKNSTRLERAASDLKKFKKWRQEHNVILLIGAAATCFMAGWVSNDKTLSLRGKKIVEVSSYYPSLTELGLWDYDRPSAKSRELARRIKIAGNPAVAVLDNESVSVSDKANLIQALSDYEVTRPKCQTLNLETTRAYSKIEGMWGGENYVPNREAFKLFAAQANECSERLDGLSSTIERYLVGIPDKKPQSPSERK